MGNGGRLGLDAINCGDCSRIGPKPWGHVFEAVNDEHWPGLMCASAMAALLLYKPGNYKTAPASGPDHGLHGLHEVYPAGAAHHDCCPWPQSAVTSHTEQQYPPHTQDTPTPFSYSVQYTILPRTQCNILFVLGTTPNVLLILSTPSDAAHQYVQLEMLRLHQATATCLAVRCVCARQRVSRRHV